MARVPEMSFCEPVHPPPNIENNENLSAAQRAKARYSLEGKCAVGQSPQASVLTSVVQLELTPLSKP